MASNIYLVAAKEKCFAAYGTDFNFVAGLPDKKEDGDWQKVQTECALSTPQLIALKKWLYESGLENIAFYTRLFDILIFFFLL